MILRERQKIENQRLKMLEAMMLMSYGAKDEAIDVLRDAGFKITEIA